MTWQYSEIERLRAEVASLRAMNGHLLAKTEAMQSQNNDLRAQLVMPVAENDEALDLRDEMMDESMVSPALEPCLPAPSLESACQHPCDAGLFCRSQH